MVDAVASQQKLHKILLSWDYFDLWKKCEAGGGVHDELKPVPQTFSTVEVRRGCRLATRARATWPWVDVFWVRRTYTPSCCTIAPSTYMCTCCLGNVRVCFLSAPAVSTWKRCCQARPAHASHSLSCPAAVAVVAADLSGMHLQHLRTP